MKASNLANGNPENERRESDFYPTPPAATHALMRHLNLPPLVIWEPACGRGDMVDVMTSHGHTVVASDLRDDVRGLGGVDFLSDEAGILFTGVDAIITNPPFAVSQKFIEVALSRCGIVAMLLKSQYWHAQVRQPLFRKHTPAHILPLTWRPDFLFDKRAVGEKANPLMDVAWSVWIAGDTSARYCPLMRPVDIDSAVNNNDNLTT